ncbi:GyrI-like domain-containing protein [Leucobacter sp. NPDC077196]|uniref:GyrI-like domain-containing protein n=1 Tax=Leucobacter sp. NPDC077196 TaxID=3154959 RepID=UPI0034136BC4
MNDSPVTPEIDTRPELHLAVVRETVPFDRIPELYDRAFPALFAAIAAAGSSPAAAPMGIMHGSPTADGLDLSVAVPISQPFPSAEGDGGADGAATAGVRVTAETLPASRTATYLLRGDFSGLSAAYERLYAWVSEQGEQPTDIAWEQYLTEPEPGGDPAHNETLIGVQLAGD